MRPLYRTRTKGSEAPARSLGARSLQGTRAPLSPSLTQVDTPAPLWVTLHQAESAWAQLGGFDSVSPFSLDPDSHCVHPMDPPTCSPHQAKGPPRPLLSPASCCASLGWQGLGSGLKPGPRAHLTALRLPRQGSPLLSLGFLIKKVEKTIP